MVSVRVAVDVVVVAVGIVVTDVDIDVPGFDTGSKPRTACCTRNAAAMMSLECVIELVFSEVVEASNAVVASFGVGNDVVVVDVGVVAMTLTAVASAVVVAFGELVTVTEVVVTAVGGGNSSRQIGAWLRYR